MVGRQRQSGEGWATGGRRNIGMRRRRDHCKKGEGVEED